MAFGEVLREFGVKVSLAFDGKKIDAANDKIEKFGAKLRSFALEAGGATAGLFEFQNLFTTNARSLENQAHLLGINTTELQEYEYAAKIAGNVNRDELVDSLQKLGSTMDQARAGNIDARRALEQLGAMSGKTGLIINRLNDPTYKVTEAFHDMAGGIAAISKTSPLAASRIVEQTLGSAKLYNVLREGTSALDGNLEAGKKNFALNENMIRQGAEVDKQMSKVWMTFRKFGYEIGFNVMKHLMPMINEFTKWFAANKKVISSGINTFLDALATTLKIVWEDLGKIASALGPVVQMLGGAKNAINLLISAFVAYKAISVGIAFAQMAASIGGVLGSMLPLISVVKGLGNAFKAFGLISSLADFLPALTLFGEGALAALSPLLPVILAISAAAVGIHDLMTILNGGDFKDTWTGKGWEKVKDGIGFVKDKLTGFATGSVAGQQVAGGKAAAAASYGAGMAAPTQQNSFNTVNNIQVPHGTTAAAASHMISKANVDAHEKLMLKAKMDAARSKEY